MNYDKMYKDFGVRPTSKKLADGTGWTTSVSIIVDEGISIRDIPFTASNIFKTEEEAVARCHEFAIKIIDERGEDLLKPQGGNTG